MMRNLDFPPRAMGSHKGFEVGACYYDDFLKKDHLGDLLQEEEGK